MNLRAIGDFPKRDERADEGGAGEREAVILEMRRRGDKERKWAGGRSMQRNSIMRHGFTISHLGELGTTLAPTGGKITRMGTFLIVALGLVGAVGVYMLVVGAWNIGRGLFGSCERLSSIYYGTALLLVGAICSFPLAVMIWFAILWHGPTHR